MSFTLWSNANYVFILAPILQKLFGPISFCFFVFSLHGKGGLLLFVFFDIANGAVVFLFLYIVIL